jgi:GlpG protein
MLVLAITVLVTLYVWLGGEQGKALKSNLLLSSQRPPDWPQLTQVASGQVWRLVTPIFLHGDWLHLFFNVLLFMALAGQVEAVRGSRRLLLLILVLAVLSNLAQYYLGATLNQLQPDRSRNPFPGNFGGLSGVVYGLFGYIWAKSKLEPQLGLGTSLQTTVILVGWFFVCLFFLSNVANGAHFGGVAVGLLLGAIPTRRRR